MPLFDSLLECDTRLGWFRERYDLIALGHLGADSNKVHLGDRGVRLCRYCGKSKPDVTFKKTAHAFPEQIGNTRLVDLWECDRCNNHFSERVEDDFGKYTMPLRTLSRIPGKSGIPTHKSTDGKLRIEAPNPAELFVSTVRDDDRVTRDDGAKTLTYTLDRQPYVPMGVFKCMVKMALAVTPESEVGRCAHLKRWILETQHSVESFPYQPLTVLTQVIPTPLLPGRISYWLLRRSPACTGSPYMVFVIQFSNAIFQITLPLPVEDRHLVEAGSFEMRFFPHVWDTEQYAQIYGPTRRVLEDMSSCEVVRGESVKFQLSYERATRLDSARAPGDSENV